MYFIIKYISHNAYYICKYLCIYINICILYIYGLCTLCRVYVNFLVYDLCLQQGWAGSVFMPDIRPEFSVSLAGYLDIRPDNPALPDIRPNPNNQYIFLGWGCNVDQRSHQSARFLLCSPSQVSKNLNFWLDFGPKNDH